jgi:hypothetical protein
MDEMESLRNKIEFLIRETNKLQQRHRKETGQTFVPPLRLNEFESNYEVREVEE